MKTAMCECGALHRVRCPVCEDASKFVGAETRFGALWLYAKELLCGFESGPHEDEEFEALRQVMLKERQRGWLSYALVIKDAPLPADAEIHEQGDDGNGERSPPAGLGSESGKDDDGAAEQNEGEGGRHD